MGGCECYFKPRNCLALLEKEREWFDVLNTLGEIRWQRAWPEESLEGQAVIIMLRNRAHWLRN